MGGIRFTAADLAQVRVAPAVSPIAEVLFALERLQRGGGHGWAAWRKSSVRRIGPWLQPLIDLAPTTCGAFDLLELSGVGPDLGESIEQILSKPGAAFAEQLEQAVVPLRPSVGQLVTDRRARDELAVAIRRFHAEAVRDQLAVDGSTVASRRQRLADIQVHEGVGALLASQHPKATWDGKEQVLRFKSDDPQLDDLRLDGRGLVIVPAMFARRNVLRFDISRPETPAVMFEPAMPATGPSPIRASGETLADLLGRTRSNVLSELAAGSLTTSELAGKVDISISSASEHASILRNAGLVGSTRSGNVVRHKLTRLGAALLERNY